MKQLFLIFFSVLLAWGLVSCASEEVKTPPPQKVEEPAPSKKPTLKEVTKKRERDIK